MMLGRDREEGNPSPSHPQRKEKKPLLAQVCEPPLTLEISSHLVRRQTQDEISYILTPSPMLFLLACEESDLRVWAQKQTPNIYQVKVEHQIPGTQFLISDAYSSHFLLL